MIEMMDLIWALMIGVLGLAIWLKLSEAKHPHRNRHNWSEKETREHLRKYHPDAYKALLEVEKESIDNGDKRSVQ